MNYKQNLANAIETNKPSKSNLLFILCDWVLPFKIKLVYSKNYSNLTKILVLRLFWMIVTEYSRFEQKSVIKILLANKYKPCQIYRRLCDMKGECFSKKFTNGLNSDLGILLQQAKSKKSTPEEKHTDRWKKVLSAVFSKEGHADSLPRYERSHHLIFSKKVQL